MAGISGEVSLIDRAGTSGLTAKKCGLTNSSATAKRCRRQRFRPLGRVVVKGKTEAVEVFEPVTVEQAKSDYMQTYRKAYTLLAEGDRAADELLRSLQTQDPADPYVSFHRDRIAEGVVSNHIEMADK